MPLNYNYLKNFSLELILLHTMWPPEVPTEYLHSMTKNKISPDSWSIHLFIVYNLKFEDCCFTIFPKVLYLIPIEHDKNYLIIT